MRKKLLVSFIAIFVMMGSVFAQTRTLTGTVTSSEDGSTLPGVTVLVKETRTASITDADGMYRITVGPEAKTLVFRFLGMLTQEVTIGSQSTLSVTLEPDVTNIEEVVVTALGIKRQEKALGYAISKVDSKEITKVNSTNFGSALYGKAAGVSIRSAPGGATSAVDIKIRGTNSINFSNSPLIIVDGIPIRNDDVNNSGYWGDQRIRGNGLIDINPEDIENLVILKGASASALYGSEAANGVVVITTKKGTSKKGLGIDVNYSYMSESPAYNPQFQNSYGPGYYQAINIGSFGSDDDGWLYAENPRYYNEGSGQYEDYNGTIRYPIYRSYANFGPAFDGEDVIGWDNKIHPYVAQPNNWNNIFQNGSSSIANVAINKAGDFGSFRFSYTRLDYQGVTRGSDHNKNTFNLNAQLNLHRNFKLDLVAQYISQNTLNRPYKINRITNNYGGFLSRFDDTQWYRDNYSTSKDYRFRTGTQSSATPDENLNYNMRATALLDYYWRTLANKNIELQDRLITSATGTWTITDDLTFRGRVANDFTSLSSENISPNSVPLSIGNSGGYSMSQSRYSTSYGDAIVTYNKQINTSVGLLVNAGFTGRRVTYKNVNAGTRGGLSTENWFHQNASINTGTRNGGSSYTELLKYAYFGTASLSFRDFAFVEFTGRQESSSTLPPGSNTFFYPSVNGSFIFSEAFGLEGALDYGKLRVAWGIVGNAPSMYAANNAYSQGSVNGIIYNSVSSSYGNDGIRPEEKHEFEVGTDLKLFGNRLGIEANLYSNRVVDQILWLDVPPTIGAGRMLTNIGELKNLGFETAVYGTVIDGKDLQWNLRGNFAVNKNTVVSLMPGVDMLTHSSMDVGSVMIVSVPGGSMGDIISYMPKYNDAGQYITDPESGYHVINFEEYDADGNPVDYGYGDTRQKVGNAMPKVVGGFGSNLEYKNFFLDFVIDYSVGGDIVSLAGHYMKGAGMWEETMWGRDAENGGLAYYTDADGARHLSDGSAGPAGERVYNNGIIIDGVKPDGSANDIIVTAGEYYMNTFQWGAIPAWGSGMSRYDDTVHKNTYVKFRELSLGYNLPKSMAEKLKCENIRVSLTGSNLFYIYRTFKQFDPETNIGSNWVNQAIVGGSTSATRNIGFSIRASF
ncbi:MAG: SusC/RagA family TonB-linked outer membrane protein [Bacteroidales bacterium]|nr:SusC/RagA family TonB-linked outer membrane protein [Bacteroidales bacterium]